MQNIQSGADALAKAPLLIVASTDERPDDLERVKGLLEKVAMMEQGATSPLL